MSDFEEQDCIECFIKFGVPRGFTAKRREDKKTFFCPNGHNMAYVKSTSDVLREKLQKQEQETQAARAEAERERRWRQESREEQRHLERRLAAQRGVTTRIRNRVAAGVCPCCNRTFINLQRHMTTKHAGFVIEEVQDREGQTIQ